MGVTRLEVMEWIQPLRDRIAALEEEKITGNSIPIRIDPSQQYQYKTFDIDTIKDAGGLMQPFAHQHGDIIILSIDADSTHIRLHCLVS